MASNRSLAEFNLSKQPELEENKQVLKEMSEQANQLCTSVKNKIDEMRKSPYILIIFHRNIRLIFETIHFVRRRQVWYYDCRYRA